MLGSGQQFWRVGPALAARGFRAVAVALPGHGDSPVDHQTTASGTRTSPSSCPHSTASSVRTRTPHRRAAAATLRSPSAAPETTGLRVLTDAVRCLHGRGTVGSSLGRVRARGARSAGGSVGTADAL
ncbi:hypothetical protein ABZS29_37010 [Kribbella sp. NPDC005582]|uniref:hypothetical protein n=1 Tax=Kribbella sp. NPDC005582 TaxID=3156893 RepID=UPI00339E609A